MYFTKNIKREQYEFTMRQHIYLVILILMLSSCGTADVDEVKPVFFNLTTSVSPMEAGEISPSEGKFKKDSTITLTATATQGYVFNKWEGDIESTENPLTVEIQEDFNIQAVFEKKNYSLIIEVEGKGSVMEQIIQPKTDYPFETEVQLTATPEDGWRFVEWKGDLLSPDNPTQISVKSDKSVTSVFKNKSYLRVFGGNGTADGNSIISLPEGGFLIAGSAQTDEGIFEGLGLTEDDIFLMKVDEELNPLWIKTYGGNSIDYANEVILTSDGGYILTGYTGSNTGDFKGLLKGNHIMFLFKTDRDGNKEWVKTYGGTDWEYGNSITETQDGGYVVTGYSASNNLDFEGLRKGRNYVFLLKVDYQGNLKWVRSYGSSGNDYGESVISTPDGGFLVAARTNVGDGDFEGEKKGLPAAILIKTDANGEKEWIKGYGGSESQKIGQVMNTVDGGYILVGGSSSVDGDFEGVNSEDGNIFLLKIDTSGIIEWVKTYGGSNSDEGTAIAMAPNGGYVITGLTESNDGDFPSLLNYSDDVAVLKTDSEGNLEWSNSFLGNHTDTGLSIASSQNDGYTIVGRTDSYKGDFSGPEYRHWNFFILKVDSDGNLYGSGSD